MNLQVHTLRQINTNVEYAIEATENSFRNKVFVVVDGDRVESFHKTKRGAESKVKKSTFSYYDEYTQDMRNAGSELKIVEICSFDIIDYYNDKNIWFETLFARWRRSQNNDYMLKQACEMGCSDEVINMIKHIIETSDCNSFPGREMVGLNEVTEVNESEEETIPETIEEISNEVVETASNVTYKLNEEKLGVEIYFVSIPSEEIRNQLKTNGFRWSRFSKCWYAKQSDDTLQLAEQLANGQIEEVEQTEIELLEIDHIEQYSFSIETEKRLIDNSLFNRRKAGDYTKQLHDDFTNHKEEVLQVMEYANNNYERNKIVKLFNSYMKRYFEAYNNYLYHSSINPSWAVTGRGGLNVSRYNKKQDQIHNKMGKTVEIYDKFKSDLSKLKNEFKKQSIKHQQEIIQQAINNQDITITFSTRKREIVYYGYKYNTRSYEGKNHFMMKLAGCYRIFESKTGKEVHSMKTNDKLNDAKSYLLYLDTKQDQAV